MKVNIVILLLLFIPSIVLANDTTYEGFQGAAQAMGDFFSDIWAFFDDDVPSFFERALAYIIEKIILFQIAAQIEAMKLAWSVAKAVIENFQVASKIANAVNALPQDVQAAISDMRILDGLNIIIQAFVARYVLRFL
ncbi:DUF2523 family protein [Pseudoalteromonas gelatinilytica]